MRIGSLNLWGFFADWPTRLEVLKTQEALRTLDVLLAQEVCQDGRDDQVEQVREVLGLEHVEYYPHKEVRGAVEGVAIFSRFPLSMVGRTDLGHHRGMVQADLPSGLTVASAHLSFEGREREEEVKALLKRVSLPHVVLGADFNGELATFSKALDRYWSAVPDRASTWPACPEQIFRSAWSEFTGREVDFDLTPRRVDHILTRGVQVNGANTVVLEHDDKFGTDHALIYSDVLVPSSF